MARVTLFPPGTGVPFFYNIDSAVGPGCPNHREDVLLVQYFLVTINNNPSAFSPPFPPLALGPGEILKVDGVPGPITFRAIRHFQDIARKRGNSVAADGRVDPAKGSGFGSITNTQFTIIFLNNGYRTIRPGQFQNIAIFAGDCPATLRSSFSLSV